MFIDDQRDRVVHCPQFFNAATIAEVRAYFAAKEVERQGRVLGERDEKALRLGAGTDSFQLDSKWFDLWHAVSDDAVHALRPFTWVVYPVRIGHISTPHHLMPWHQDVGHQDLLGRSPHRREITCYVPLEHDAEWSATLQFAIGEFPRLPHLSQGEHGASIADPRFIDTVTFRPAFGDAIVFGDHTPHRTVVPYGGRIDSRSLEFHLIDPADAVSDVDYFDLDRRCFVRVGARAREVA
jgi:hypothetical protein